MSDNGEQPEHRDQDQSRPYIRGNDDRDRGNGDRDYDRKSRRDYDRGYSRDRRDSRYNDDRRDYRGGRDFDQRRYGDGDRYRYRDDRDRDRGDYRRGGYDSRDRDRDYYRRDGPDRFRRGGDYRDRPQQRRQWSEEDINRLKELVKTHEPLNRDAWKEIAQKMDKPDYICYNKHIQINEPEWTTEQDEVLLKFYEEAENKQNIDVSGILEQLGGHTKRGSLYRLERLTRDKNINPVYRMGRENIQNIE